MPADQNPTQKPARRHRRQVAYVVTVHEVEYGNPEAPERREIFSFVAGRRRPDMKRLMEASEP